MNKEKSKEYCSKQFLGTCEYLQEAKTNYEYLLKVSTNKRAMRNEGLVRDLSKLKKRLKQLASDFKTSHTSISGKWDSTDDQIFHNSLIELAKERFNSE